MYNDGQYYNWSYHFWLSTYTLVNFVKVKRKMRACSLNKSCQSKTCSPDMEQVAHNK